MALSRLLVQGVHPSRQQEAPQIAVVDLMNSSVMHVTTGDIVFAVDMDMEKVLRCSTPPIDDGDDSSEGPCFFQLCVLPPWLESSRIPSSGTLSSGMVNVQSNTLSDILVRVDRSKKN